MYFKVTTYINGLKENSDHTELTACIVKLLLNQPPCGVTIMLMNLQSTVECVAFRPNDVHHKFETKSKDNITFESSKITQGHLMCSLCLQ